MCLLGQSEEKQVRSKVLNQVPSETSPAFIATHPLTAQSFSRLTWKIQNLQIPASTGSTVPSKRNHRNRSPKGLRSGYPSWDASKKKSAPWPGLPSHCIPWAKPRHGSVLQFLPAAKRAARLEGSAGLQSCIAGRLGCCSTHCIAPSSLPAFVPPPWSITSSVLHPWATQDPRVFLNRKPLLLCPSQAFCQGTEEADEGRKREKCAKIAKFAN